MLAEGRAGGLYRALIALMGLLEGSRGDIRPAPLSLHPLLQAQAFRVLSAYSSLKQAQGS